MKSNPCCVRVCFFFFLFSQESLRFVFFGFFFFFHVTILVWFGFLGFYGISTFVGYLTTKPFLCK